MKAIQTGKRLLAVVLSLAAALAALTACGNGSGGGFDASRSLAVVVREEGSGTRSAFMSIADIYGHRDPAGVQQLSGTAAVNNEVGSNPAAITYESIGFAAQELRRLRVNGVEPTAANVLNGTYPIARPLSLVYLPETLEDPLYAAFASFLATSNARDIIDGAGFVSTQGGNAPEYTINPELGGQIDISGSTSVQPMMIELAEEFERLQPNVQINITGGGTGTGYNNAQGGVSDFGMISEEFDPAGRGAPDLRLREVARDGIAVIVHPSNPLEDITMEQLARIFSGEADDPITAWNQLVTE